ncbi:hypothetical protein J3A83DRAFT_1863404 [Scleroderma citrinum]
MVATLPDEFNAPIFSAVSDENNYPVNVGGGGRLVVVPDARPALFHFRRVEGPLGDLAYYEISFHHMNTLVEERHVVAIPGATPHKWIIQYQADRGAYTILNLPIRPSTPWTVSPDKTVCHYFSLWTIFILFIQIVIGVRELPPYPNRMLFRIPILPRE